jgi:hypothetical protein
MSRSLTFRVLIAGLFCCSLGVVAVPGAAAQEASPAAETDRSAFVPAPEECVIEPLSAEAIALFATPAAVNPAASPEAPIVPFGAPDGDPADAETVAAVSAVNREAWACINGGDWPRFLAYWTTELVHQTFLPEDIAFLTSQPVVAPPIDEQTALYATLDVEILPDGRVGLYEVVDTAGDPLPVEINYQIFVLTDHGWRLDGFTCFASDGSLC